MYRLPKVLGIQLKRFTVEDGGTRKVSRSVKIPTKLKINSFSESRSYKLVSISHHAGGLNSGHYYSECVEDDTWYTYNDSAVSHISAPTSSKTAYVLFYA